MNLFKELNLRYKSFHDLRNKTCIKDGFYYATNNNVCVIHNLNFKHDDCGDSSLVKSIKKLISHVKSNCLEVSWSVVNSPIAFETLTFCKFKDDLSYVINESKYNLILEKISAYKHVPFCDGIIEELADYINDIDPDKFFKVMILHFLSGHTEITFKGEHRILYSMQNSDDKEDLLPIFVNPNYFLDCLTVHNDECIRVFVSKDYRQPILFQSKDTMTMLMPIVFDK